MTPGAVWVLSPAVDRMMYIMPLLQMQSLADHSTHLRATCNFPTHGLKKTDYARDKLKNHGTFSYQCLHYEYINITWGASVVKTAQQHWKPGNLSSGTINGYKSKTECGCDLNGSPWCKWERKQFWTISIKYHQLRPSLFVILCLHNSALAWICLQLLNLKFKNGK